MEILNKIKTLVLTVIGILMVVILTVNGLGRYLFSSSFPWAQEAVRILFVWGCFIGITEAFIGKKHIGFDLVKNMNGFTQGVSDFLNNLCLIFVGIIVIIYGMRFNSTVGNVPLPATGIKISYIYVAGIIAGVAWVIIGGYSIIKAGLNFKRTNNKVFDMKQKTENI